MNEDLNNDYSWKYEQMVQGIELPWFITAKAKLGRLVDALALGGDEGRDKLR